jgi:hypothetical protein
MTELEYTGVTQSGKIRTFYAWEKVQVRNCQSFEKLDNGERKYNKIFSDFWYYNISPTGRKRTAPPQKLEEISSYYNICHATCYN